MSCNITIFLVNSILSAYILITAKLIHIYRIYFYGIISKDTVSRMSKSVIKPLFAVVVKEEGDTCPICMDPIRSRRKIHTTSCDHSFHLTCFRRLNSTKCPCCREDQIPTLEHRIIRTRSIIKEKKAELKKETAIYTSAVDEYKIKILKLEIELDLTRQHLSKFKWDEAPYLASLKNGVCEARAVLKKSISWRTQEKKVAKAKVHEKNMARAWIIEIEGCINYWKLTNVQKCLKKRHFEMQYMAMVTM